MTTNILFFRHFWCTIYGTIKESRYFTCWGLIQASHDSNFYATRDARTPYLWWSHVSRTLTNPCPVAKIEWGSEPKQLPGCGMSSPLNDDVWTGCWGGWTGTWVFGGCGEAGGEERDEGGVRDRGELVQRYKGDYHRGCRWKVAPLETGNKTENDKYLMNFA